MNAITKLSAARTINVLIVDDHAMFREGLAAFLSNHSIFAVSGQASTSSEAMQHVLLNKPDIVTVDLSLRSGHGIELIKQIRSQDRRIKILVLSMHDESLYAERTIRAGAMGYLNKAHSSECVVDALRTILDGQIYLSPAMTARLLASQMGRHLTNRSPIEKLSDRELQVFEAIGNGLAVREIAAQLQLSPKTVETYRENIKAKLDVCHANDLMRHAVRWVLEEAGVAS
jgi:DNA-binding NarL/FixJ family response regulator